jgi:hypothetical protein
MRTGVLFGEVGDDEVSVVLSRGDVRVAEQFLHVADVGAGAEEVRCERVAQRVGRDAAFEARTGSGSPDDGVDRMHAEALTASSSVRDE